MRAGIIGSGGIAKCLQHRLESMGHEVLYLLGRSTYSVGGAVHDRGGRTLAQLFAASDRFLPDVMFIAISTLDKGECARDYILDCVNAGVRVITCEKGSLAYHAAQLQPYLRGGNGTSATASLRCNAAVTGGTQALSYLRSRHLNTRAADVEAVINGTCNFIFDEVARGGRTLGEACQEASRLGYTEPGANDPLSLINGELRDVVMKTCVLFNTTLAQSGFIIPDMIGAFQLTSEQLEELSAKAASHRLVVAFSNRPIKKTLTFFRGNFEISVDGWHIRGGFRTTHGDAELLSWIPSGVGNAVHVVEGALGSGGKYTLAGPGAGYEPTVTAMLNDLFSP